MGDDAIDLGINDLTGAVEVGAGGFGTVYKAHQDSLRRDVAVKLVANTVQDRKVRIRFEREIQAMGMLSGHPNIVTVYDSGFTASGQPYILMDYMEQGSLGDRLERDGALPWTDVLEIMVKVCGALETAHQAGILHRDLKPENVLVSAYGEPKLGDFGIARLKGGPETGTSSLTASIEHVAPELLEAKKPDAASDLYALGSTMFKLLSGSAAFIWPGDESIVPALTRIRDEPVPDLRQRGIPPEVAECVERAMAKDPQQRYASAVQMGHALRDVQRHLGLMPSSMPVREEDAAAARESTRTIHSDDLARSMEDLGLGAVPTDRDHTGPTGGPPGVPTGTGPTGAPTWTGPTGPPTGPVSGPHGPGPHAPGPHAPGQAPRGPAPAYQAPQQPPGYQSPGPPAGAPAYASQGLTGQYGQPGQPARSGTPWGKVLGAGAAVVGLAVVVGVAVVSLGGTDDPPPPPPPPTTEPVVEQPATEYAAYERLLDDTSSITIDVPREWGDIDGGPWVVDGNGVGVQIVAAADVGAFRSSWGTPGVIFGASETLRASFDPAGLLDAVSFADQCTYDGRSPYSDAEYTGWRDDYSGCGNTDATYTIIAAEPATQDQILLVQFQSVAPRDADALQRAINTFFLLSEDAAGDAASEPAPDATADGS